MLTVQAQGAAAGQFGGVADLAAIAVVFVVAAADAAVLLGTPEPVEQRSDPGALEAQAERARAAEEELAGETDVARAALEKVVASREAMRSFQFTSQEKVDAICEAMVAAAMREAARLGELAHEETGFGYAPHKQLKNEFAAQGVWDSIRDVATCGVLRRDEKNQIVEIGWPVGVLCALTPSTNPTSTAIFKILIGVKARNAVVVAPHPSAKRCTAEAVRVMVEAPEHETCEKYVQQVVDVIKAKGYAI